MAPVAVGVGPRDLDFFQSPFYNPEQANNSQLAVLTVIYGVILFQSSGLIAGGSELLLLIPSVAGLVGSIVLPILGAVPDGVMTLFSGLGDPVKAQSSVGVGVGVLAGSTVMLLTFPWFLAIYAGRVPFKDGQPDYRNKDGDKGLFSSGVSVKGEVAKNAKFMFVTTLVYLVIQIPATMYEVQDGALLDKKEQLSRIREFAQKEHIISLVGMVLSFCGFFMYLYICWNTDPEDKVAERIIAGINRKEITLAAAVLLSADEIPTPSGAEPLLTKEAPPLLVKIAKPFFGKYDTDKNGTLSKTEFIHLLEDLGESSSQFSNLAEKKFKEYDANNSGTMEFKEFVVCLYDYMTDETKKSELKAKYEADISTGRVPKYIPAYGAEGDEEEEEEEIPEDFKDLPPDQQQRRIIFRACWMMLLGTFIVLFVSDPFVDILNVWGDRFGIPAFYVSFLVAPFASNASELLSAYVYAAKKTEKSITTALSTLVGAACMNNTFVLFIFFALIYCQGLAWEFTAETIAIMVIQWLIGAVALKRVQSMFLGCIVLLCYPACLGIVAGLESFGMD